MRESFSRVLLAGSLSLPCGMALADGSGTLNDANRSLSYTSGAYVMANQVGFQTGTHVCEEGTPLCDVYTLTVEISDAVRNADTEAYVEFLVSSSGDFDLVIQDSGGNDVAVSEETGNETVEIQLAVLPNGTYKLWLIPWLAAGDTAELGVAVVSSKSRSTLPFAGALTPVLLLPFGLLALRRRRR